MFVKLPILVAVAAVPLTAVVVPFVGESDGDSILAAAPDFLDESVVEFPLPLAGEKGLYGLTSLQEFGAVAPSTVRRIGERNACRIARIPGVLGHPCFLCSALECKGG